MFIEWLLGAVTIVRLEIQRYKNKFSAATMIRTWRTEQLFLPCTPDPGFRENTVSEPGYWVFCRSSPGEAGMAGVWGKVHDWNVPDLFEWVGILQLWGMNAWRIEQRMKVDTLVQARISVNLNDKLNSKDKISTDKSSFVLQNTSEYIREEGLKLRGQWSISRRF